jgi:hypothetical protein
MSRVYYKRPYAMGRATEFIEFINKDKPDKRKNDYLTITQDLIQIRYEYRTNKKFNKKRMIKALLSVFMQSVSQIINNFSSLY